MPPEASIYPIAIEFDTTSVVLGIKYNATRGVLYEIDRCLEHRPINQIFKYYVNVCITATFEPKQSNVMDTSESAAMMALILKTGLLRG